MKTRKGFTLIELLVVIFIIALLISILMPALSSAKKQATGAACLINEKSLLLAWIMYKDDNDDKLVGGQVWYDYNIVEPHDWVHPVITASHPRYVSGMPGHQLELEGIKAGALYPYTQEVGVYNCPGDKTWRSTNGPLTLFDSPWRSYAASDAMNGEWRGDYQYKKYSAIKRPAERMVYLEEEEVYGANWGSWIIADNNWWDPIAIWHSKGSTNLAFADGHAIAYMWSDQSTIDMAKEQTLGKQPYPGEGEDLRYIQKAYHHDLPLFGN